MSIFHSPFVKPFVRNEVHVAGDQYRGLADADLVDIPDDLIPGFAGDD